MTAGVALELAGLVGFVNVVDANAPMVRLLAATSIFIDGTKDIIPTGNSQAPDRMRGTLSGVLDQGYDYVSTPGAGGNYYVQYPRSFGILTGLTDPTYDASRTIATQNTITAIKDARAQNPNDPIYVVGYSQGANAESEAIRQLQAEGYDTSNITFVLVGNGARNDGGLWARLPAGVYVPLIGLSFGASMNPDPNGPQVIQISKQYDGASDVPQYVLNPVAWANAALGFVYVHNGYYQDVDFDLNHDGTISSADVALAQQDPAHYIVTTNGNISDVVIRNPEGQLPLTRPLLDLGVPPEIVKALDPLLRAIIETGYNRPPNGGVYPAQPQHLELLPPVTRWEADADAVAAGLKETIHRLEALNTVHINPISPLTADSAVPQESGGQQLTTAKHQEPTIDQETPQGGPQLTAVKTLDTPDTGAASSGTPSGVGTSEAEQGVSGAPDPVSAPTTPDAPSAPKKPQTNVVRGPIGGSPALSGLKTVTAKINGAVTDAMTKVKDALGANRTGNKVTPPTAGSEGAGTSTNTGTTQSDTDGGTSGSGSGATDNSGS
ncbi:PE-PPE domain-containing protein [Mycobacterium aquaticum]|uniref:PE-PPE domain-containing protein n=1 Tax=Mycobacterium aquaticum TaxID=1927124 RepID=A0A1X0B9V7_9MYCO|nr:PE-PPE domain-containing protein [Mycobacterium aquaticum]ORA38616.1 hypothetical protein BST13_04310 [Mycobacterium aquaticum]